MGEVRDERLALELLKELKTQTKRYFIIATVAIIMLFISSMIWLFAWCLPVETVEATQVIQESFDSDGNNSYIGEDGTINVETNN